MSAIRAIGTFFTRQRTYRPDKHWPLILAVTLVEIGVCIAITSLTPWWIWLLALSLYFGVAPYCVPRGIGRSFADLLFAKQASYSYLAVLMLGALAVDIAFFAMLAAITAMGLACLVVGVVSVLVIGVGYLIFGLGLLILYGWWIIIPVAIVWFFFRSR